MRREAVTAPTVPGVRNVPDLVVAWREPVSDEEMVDLVASSGGSPVPGWWDRIRPHSLGWVTARSGGVLLGFVNVAWDGGDHAFLLDTKTRGDRRREGIGATVVRAAIERAEEAGCEWLHVDFRPELTAFYLDACGFVRTDAGLVHLHSLPGPSGLPGGASGAEPAAPDPPAEELP
jgi:ribosomal protein S18 acetylase RimI-like enzyme